MSQARVVIVGPCASGKTTLVEKLRALGYDAYSAAQEHAGARTLWRRRSPEFVIYLDVSVTAVRRRRRVPWGAERLETQRRRLAHAREHASLYLVTDRFDADKVAGAARRVIEALTRKQTKLKADPAPTKDADDANEGET